MFGQRTRVLFSGLKEGCSGLIGTERSWEGGAWRKCQQLSWASAAPLVHSLLENGIEPLRKPCAHLVCEQLDDCLRILWPELIHSNCSLLCMLKLHSEILKKNHVWAIFFHKTKFKVSLTNNDGSRKYLT